MRTNGTLSANRGSANSPPPPPTHTHTPHTYTFTTSHRRLAATHAASHDFSRGRLFRFALADKKGRKLGVVGIAALLFALETAMGRGYMPTKPPTVQQFCAGGRADCE